MGLKAQEIGWERYPSRVSHIKLRNNDEAVPLCKVPFLSCSGGGHKPRSLFGGSKGLSKCINNGS